MDSLAELIQWLNDLEVDYPHDIAVPPNKQAAAALEQMGRENERLRFEAKYDAEMAKAQHDTIRELEAKRDNLTKARDFAIACHDTQVIDKDTIAGELAKMQAERETLTLAIEVARNRITELVNERDAAVAREKRIEEEITNVHREADAIKAKTIKELAALFEPPPDGWGQIDLRHAQARILSLMPPEADEGGE